MNNSSYTSFRNAQCLICLIVTLVVSGIIINVMIDVMTEFIHPHNYHDRIMFDIDCIYTSSSITQHMKYNNENNYIYIVKCTLEPIDADVFNVEKQQIIYTGSNFSRAVYKQNVICRRNHTMHCFVITNHNQSNSDAYYVLLSDEDFKSMSAFKVNVNRLCFVVFVTSCVIFALIMCCYVIVMRNEWNMSFEMCEVRFNLIVFMCLFALLSSVCTILYMLKFE